jgi:hypothetical protein
LCDEQEYVVYKEMSNSSRYPMSTLGLLGDFYFYFYYEY